MEIPTFSTRNRIFLRLLCINHHKRGAKLCLTALALALAMGLSACGNSQSAAMKLTKTGGSMSVSARDGKTVPDTSGIDVLNPPKPEPAADALTAYRTLVEQTDTYFIDEYSGDDVPVINYTYALIRMQQEHQIPALVLRKETVSSKWGNVICSAVVFQYDPVRGAAIRLEGQLDEGVGTGYRGSLAMSEDEVGILQISWSSGTGNGTIMKVTAAEGKLRSETLFDGCLFDESDVTLNQITSLEIDWHDITDLSALDNYVWPETQTENENTGLLAGYASNYADDYWQGELDHSKIH